MTIKDTLAAGLSNLTTKAGRSMTIRYFSKTTGSVWDDDVTLAVSGNLNISGILQAIDSGGKELQLVQQGRLKVDDMKLFVNGSTILTNGSLLCKIIIGSDSYSPLAGEGMVAEVEGTQIYKKIYIRRLTTGSLIGE